jgi:hypothetical protein
MSGNVMVGLVLALGLVVGLGLGEVEGCENQLVPCQTATAATTIMMIAITAIIWVLNLPFV